MTANLLPVLPSGLSGPLLQEFHSIHTNYLEHRWLPAELQAGRFCEVVYSILDGHATGQYPSTPCKPSDFPTACKQLESKIKSPRSFKILIPRLLPALFEVRNNRNVGHAGGDVDSNQMDSTMVVCSCNWIMAELIRVFHNLSPNQAQKVVDGIVQYPIPLIWKDGDKRRVLDASMRVKDQVLALLLTENKLVQPEQLRQWVECSNKQYFIKTLDELHKKRYLEFDRSRDSVQILAPGTKYISDILSAKSN